MHIVFRNIKWTFKKDWYSMARFKEHKIIDCGWFSIVLKGEE